MCGVVGVDWLDEIGRGARGSVGRPTGTAGASQPAAPAGVTAAVAVDVVDDGTTVGRAVVVARDGRIERDDAAQPQTRLVASSATWQSIREGATSLTRAVLAGSVAIDGRPDALIEFVAHLGGSAPSEIDD